MRLKSIKLAGFKSFVDPTTVTFATNMSSVVGPNGCGKSNIIDAVRWVMGESSAKNLRGESMTDVIFNGSVNRKPVGQASIELIFDNGDGSLGGEYAAFAEISIKRKVSRDGQSDYFLNGQKCRKPGHAVQGGDVLTFAQGARIRVIRVREIGARRGPSSEAQALFDDLDAATTPEDAGNGDDWSRSCRLNDPPGFANQSAVTPALFSKDEMP